MFSMLFVAVLLKLVIGDVLSCMSILVLVGKFTLHSVSP